MKISLNWIKDFTNITITPQELCEIISSKLSEVESLKSAGSNDMVIEIENKALTHRGDCFSMEGIAREISALTKSSLNIPSYAPIKGSPERLLINIDIENSKDCPRYTAVKIKEVRLEPSPKYIQERLINCGMRPVNNIVDFTNYAMLETGQPLHAFDAVKLNKENKYNLGVRHAKEGECLETLDGVNRKLSKENLVITNEDKPIAIAGIMGGKDTEVDESTKEMILEAANFNNFVTRRSSRKLGLRTEASLRFEKSLDPNLTSRGIEKFISLITKHNAGKVEGLRDSYPEEKKSIIIELTLDFINKTIGKHLEKKEILEILAFLTFKTDEQENSIRVTVPTFRNDISIKEDLIEEIARIYGYEKITPTLPMKDISPATIDSKLGFIRQVKDLLKVLGYSEIYSYSFVGEALYKKVGLTTKNTLELINPLSPQLKFVRDNLLPSMYEKVELNKNNFDKFKLFEIGKEIKTKNSKELPEEIYTLCAAYFDKNQTNQELLYRKSKGDMEVLTERFSDLDSDIAPTLIEPGLMIYKIDLEYLYKKYSTHKNTIKDISTYPPIIENVSFYTKKESKIGEIIKKIKSLDTLITEIEFEDTYESEDKKSITLKIIYQDLQKSLSVNEITPIRENIIALLEKEGFQVRR